MVAVLFFVYPPSTINRGPPQTLPTPSPAPYIAEEGAFDLTLQPLSDADVVT